MSSPLTMMDFRGHPQIQANDDLQAICREIVAEGKSIREWDRIESCDAFQRGPFCGGYDACEQEFTFSYYDGAKKEWWFSFSLPVAEKIARGDEYWLVLSAPV